MQDMGDAEGQLKELAPAINSAFKERQDTERIKREIEVRMA